MKNQKLIAIILIVISIFMIGAGMMMFKDSDNNENKGNPNSEEEVVNCIDDYENMNFKEVSFKNETYTISFKTLSCMTPSNENSNAFQSKDTRFEMETSIEEKNPEDLMTELQEKYYSMQPEKNIHVYPYRFEEEKFPFILLRIKELSSENEEEKVIEEIYHILYPVDENTFNIKFTYTPNESNSEWKLEDGFFEEMIKEIKISK